MENILASLIVIVGATVIALLTGVLKVEFLNKKERKEKGNLVINGKKIF